MYSVEYIQRYLHGEPVQGVPGMILGSDAFTIDLSSIFCTPCMLPRVVPVSFSYFSPGWGTGGWGGGAVLTGGRVRIEPNGDGTYNLVFLLH